MCGIIEHMYGDIGVRGEMCVLSHLSDIGNVV